MRLTVIRFLQVVFGVVFLAEKQLGNTLYRAGKRIQLRWQCLDAEGAVLAEGADKAVRFMQSMAACPSNGPRK